MAIARASETQAAVATLPLLSRIMGLLDGSDHPMYELSGLLRTWREMQGTQFGTKMEAWKASRIEGTRWNNPVLEFSMVRHSGAWDRVQRWSYNFRANQAELVREQGIRQNASYTKKAVLRDAQGNIDALTTSQKHAALSIKGGLVRMWLGRLPDTQHVAYDIPLRTAMGRRKRLKTPVAELMQALPEYQRLPDMETTSTLASQRREA